MFFYGFLVVVVLGIVAWLIRSPIVRQLRRGNGVDTARFGNRMAGHIADSRVHALQERHHRTNTYRVSKHVIKTGDVTTTGSASLVGRDARRRRSAAQRQSARASAEILRARPPSDHLPPTHEEPTSRWRELVSRWRGRWPRRRIAKYALIGTIVGVWVTEEWQMLAAAWRGG
jgi:hypothetical protein